MARAFFTAGDARADVEQTLAFDEFLAAVGIFEKRVAAVDDDVAGFQARQQLLNKIVHRLARLDEHHDPARFLELLDHFFDGMGAEHFGAVGFFGQKFVHLGGGAVVSHHDEAVVVHVQNQILAHDRQADQGDVRVRFHCFTFSKIALSRYKSRRHAPENFSRVRRRTAGRCGPLAFCFPLPGRSTQPSFSRGSVWSLASRLVHPPSFIC